MIEQKTALSDEELGFVSGGAASPGTAMLCKAVTPLYGNNPAGTHYRSVSNTIGTLSPGSVVKLFEYGPKYCKVIGNGQVGWVETASLEKA